MCWAFLAVSWVVILWGMIAGEVALVIGGVGIMLISLLVTTDNGPL